MNSFKITFAGTLVAVLFLFTSHASASAPVLSHSSVIQQLLRQSSQTSVGKVLGTATGITISLTSPQASENLNISSSYQIKWATAGTLPNVDIAVVRLLPGASEGNLESIRGGYIAKNIPNTGSYTWDMNQPLTSIGFGSQFDLSKVTAGSYYIAVGSDDVNGASSEPVTFTIIRPGVTPPSVTINSNGSTSIMPKIGDMFPVAWNATNASSCSGAGDEFATAEAQVWNTLTNLPTSGTRSLKAASGLEFIDINCQNSYGDLVSAHMSAFSTTTTPTPTPVPTPSIKIVSPNGGESYKKGDKVTLSWSSTSYNGEVDLHLLGISPSSLSAYIAKNVPNTGSYIWDTNQMLTSDNGSPASLSAGKYYFDIYNGATPVALASGSFSITTPLTGANKLPKGNIEAVDYGGYLRGWSYDPDAENDTTQIHVYLDGAAGVSTTMVKDYSDWPRSDVNKTLGVAGNHGFNIYLPDEWLDGQAHTAYIYSIDMNDSAKHTYLGSIKFRYPKYTTTANLRDGILVNDGGKYFVIENNSKRGFPSLAVLSSLGYNTSNAFMFNLSSITTGKVMSSSEKHPRGSVVESNGTVYFVGANVIYPYPSAEVFTSWENKFSDVIKANSYDLALPHGSPVAAYAPVASDVTARDAKRIASIHQIQTGLELYFNDCGQYPATLTTVASNGCPPGTNFGIYMLSIPTNPAPGGTPFIYTASGSNQSYSLTFSLESAMSGLSAGLHTASPSGIK